MRHAMAGLKFKGVTLTAEQFERLVRAHETFARGLPGGARAIPRMVIARKMDCVQRIEARIAGLKGGEVRRSTGFLGLVDRKSVV